jgi:phosphatidate cytidylyltransferase
MLATRLATAGVLLPLFVGALLWLPNSFWIAFLLPPLLIGSWEWATLAGYRRAGCWLFSGVILLSGLGVLYPSLEAGTRPSGMHFPADGIAYGLAGLFWIAVVPVWLLRKWRLTHPFVLGLAGWIVLVPTWLALVRLQAQPLQLLILLGIVWIADSAAYLTGKSFGKSKLAPQISPGKTWEGVVGAGVAVAVYYAVLRSVSAPADALLGGVTGVILCAGTTMMSIEGDLFESWMKRQAGVKDSGRMLPGHGGILDRIDGLTASMPLVALLLLYAR